FLPNHTYQESEITFAPGDLLLLYSDGIPEAMNPAREQFGEERLVALLKAHSGSSQALIDAIIEAVTQHAAEAPPSDDMTLLAARRVSKGEL
ncbi:MAG: PP2C family protein-serine/threonine phosphatase, partial [Gammaproteobacteria bacterium]